MSAVEEDTRIEESERLDRQRDRSVPRGGEIFVPAGESDAPSVPPLTQEDMEGIKEAAEEVLERWRNETAEQRARREKFERATDAEAEAAGDDIRRLSAFILGRRLRRDDS